MESTNTKKIIIATVILILVVCSIYFLFLKPAPEKPSVDEYGNAIQSEVIGKDLISLLNELQAVNLSTALFENPAFVRLTDFTSEFSKEPKGRNNPFQPL